MAHILLINSYNEVKKDNNFSIGLFSLATILKKAGHTVRVLDIDYLFTTKQILKTGDLSKDLELISNYILDENPNIVGLYTLSNSYYSAINLSKILKEKNINLKIMFGGPHATITAKDTLTICPWIDVIGLGEGEQTILDIVDKLEKGLQFEDETGVAYIKDNTIVCNATTLISNLDEIPIIDYSLLEGKIPDAMPLDVGRGCPFACKFCITSTFWHRNFRLKSADRIIEEILDLKNQFNINYFLFEHDLFTANRKKIIEFCTHLLQRNISIKWSCSSRIDTLDGELIDLMSSAGCTRIFLGIETGSERMQKIINKHLNIKDVLEIVRLLKAKGITIIASFMYGFPEETSEDIEQTLDLIYKLRRLGVNNTQLHRFSVFPATTYFDELKDHMYYSSRSSDCASTTYNDTSMIEYINNNKNMFPHFLDFDMGARRDYDFLDTYIACFTPHIMKYFTLTYALLLSKFKTHTEIFNFFKEVNTDILSDSDSSKNTIEADLLQELKCFSNIIEVLETGKFKNVISEIFKFESDIIQFTYYETIPEKTASYSIDVYELKKNGITQKDLLPANTTLLFTRIDKTNIHIDKVTN